MIKIKPYYTEKAYKELQKEVVIIVDKREQKNEHIKNWFDSRKINYINRSLKTGDYCFMLPKNIEKGRFEDLHFVDELIIEKKNSLSELASSLVDHSFHNELKRMQATKHKYLIVEQANGFQGILNQDYRSQYDPKAFFATMHTIMIKYNLQVIFCSPDETALHIATICYKILDKYVEH